MIDGPFCEVLRPEATSRRQSAGRKLPPLRVLIVDDGETNRDLISLVLTEAGATVACAENGRDGVAAAAREEFDLILMDMQMPVMDGYTAARALREKGCRLPIVALTAHAMRDDQDKCLAAGCSSYLTKPIGIDSLLETVLMAAYESGKAQVSEASFEPADSPPAPIRSTLPTHLPKFQRIVDEFLFKLQQKLAAMESALEADNWAELYELAHWLKGSGGTVGFNCLTAPAAELEQRAKERHGAAARQIAGALRELANRMSLAEV